MRKWKQGILASVVTFFGIALTVFGYLADNIAIAALSLMAAFFSFLYGCGLVVVFIFQAVFRWRKKGQSTYEEAVKTKVVAVYECGKCKREYAGSQYCPYCGSPYRRTVKETTERETVGVKRAKMVR